MAVDEQKVYARLMSVADIPTDSAARNYLRQLLRRVWDDAQGSTIRITVCTVLPGYIDEDATSQLLPTTLLSWLRDLRLRAVSKKTIRSHSAFFFFDALLVALESGFYLESELFEWVRRNRNGLSLMVSYTSHANSVVGSMLEADGIPSCELLVRGDRVQRIEFDTDSAFVRCLLMEVYRKSILHHSQTHLNRSKTCKFFTTSLGFTPASLGDFTVDTLVRQMEFFESYKLKNGSNPSHVLLLNVYSHIIELLPDNQQQFTLETGVTFSTIIRLPFWREWKAGFRPVIHNPTDPVPNHAKWILYPNQDELRNSSISPHGTLVDVTYERAPVLERLLASWLWTECNSTATICGSSTIMRRLFDGFSLGKSGKILVTSVGVMTWLGMLGNEMGDSGLRHCKAWARSIISFGEKERVLDIEPTVMLMLSASERQCRWERNENEAANKDDLKKLAAELEARTANSLYDELIYCAFVVITLTHIRLGEVFNLRVGDLVKGVGGIRIIQSSGKTNGSGQEDIQVTQQVYKLLSAVISMTEKVRMDAPESLSDYLFICRSPIRNRIIKMNSEKFYHTLTAACKELGIPTIGARSIRRRYETEVVLKGVERNLSRLALKPLTGHASLATTERHYMRDDIRNYLEATYGIEIGVPKLRGEIVSDDDINEDIVKLMVNETMVEGGAGYCRNVECNISGTTTCLMCPSFITTPRCLPEMEEALSNVQIRLANSMANTHDREHLLAVKRMYLGYIGQMMSIKAGETG